MPQTAPGAQSVETPLPSRMKTRSANATTHPAAHLASKPRVRGAPTQAAIRKEKKAAKEAKALAAMDRISEIEGRNAAKEQTNVTPHASASGTKRTYADVVSGSGSEGEEEPPRLDVPSSCEPSQLDALRSETATAKSDSATESDSEAFEPGKGSVTEDYSDTQSDTPPPIPQKKRPNPTKKTAKTVLSDDDFDFHSPPPSQAAAQPMPVKSKPAPKLGPSNLEPPKKKRKSQVLRSSEGDSSQTTVPARKKAAAPRGKLELDAQDNPTPEPTVMLKPKPKSKPGFRATMKERVQVKIEPEQDEHMVSCPG